MKRILALILVTLLGGCAAVRGVAPTYLQAVTDDVPNRGALSHLIWVPGLDDSFVPQGLANAGPYLFVSAYRPTPELKSNTGPCRVFRVEMETGRTAGHFDIPPGTCTHSGGLAYAGGGKLMLADTYQLFLIDIDKALASGTSAGAQKAVKIAGLLRGSYATVDGRDLWIGTWTKDKEKAFLFKLAPGFFDDFDGQTVREDRAAERIAIPLEAQGAAFDRVGNIWLSASTGSWGKLFRLDRQGNVKAEYPMTAGLEDLTVDEQGRLWGLSESGTRKYMSWATKFPYIFRIDTGKLK